MKIYGSAFFEPLQQQTLYFQKTWKDRICMGLLSSVQALFCSNTLLATWAMHAYLLEKWA